MVALLIKSNEYSLLMLPIDNRLDMSAKVPTNNHLNTRKMKRNLLLVFILSHLFIVSSSAVIGSYSRIADYCVDKEFILGDKVEKGNFEKTLFAITSNPVINNYLIISGTNDSYGFFAPRIGNSFLVECVQKDSNNIELGRFYLPTSLQTHEGILRFNTMLSNFQSDINQLSKKEKIRVYKIFIKEIAQEILDANKNQRAASSTATFYLYKYPDMTAYLKGQDKPSLIALMNIELGEKTIVLNTKN